MVTKYYEVFTVEADSESAAEEIAYTDDATLVDSYAEEDEIYDIVEVDDDE